VEGIALHDLLVLGVAAQHSYAATPKTKMLV
jgi:hypothetical protein